MTIYGAGGANIKKIVLGKTLYDPGTDTYVDVEAKIAVLNDGGTMRRWARKCPAASAAHITMDSYPSDSDPYFRYHYVGPDPAYYATTFSYAITRVSTGTLVYEYSSGVLASDGPGEQYTFVVTAQITSDYDIPTDFRPYQTVGDPYIGSGDTFADPRAIV